ncbi:MAG: VTT domain-containing protein [Gemmatimonadetes bacterium]|nr:VTT domain-containing protein [Gemmatimonadota bacterium]
MTAGVIGSMPRRGLLFRPVAPDAWDRLLWASGAVALLGIVLASAVTQASDLAVLFSLTLLTNGPYSIVLPVAYEPVVMVFGRLYPPVLVAALGTLGQIMVEHVNYRVYGAALRSRLFAGMRESRWVRRVVCWFRAQPFFTVFVCALTPIPFWAARICASLDGYPLGRYLAATAAGRFPRLWFYAALGSALPVDTNVLLVGGILVPLPLALAMWLRGRRAEGVP